MRGFWVSAAAFAALASFTASASVVAFPDNIFLPDDRQPVSRFREPSRWVGKLELPHGSACTATLVHKDLILTAAHCVVDKETQTIRQGTYKFRLGLTAGKARVSSGVTQVWIGSTTPSERRITDWAILRLARPLGERYGWVEIEDVDLKGIIDQDLLWIVGYSSGYRDGLTASVESSCRFTVAQETGTFLHDCDTLPGVSGAPMFVRGGAPGAKSSFRIVAINVASRRIDDPLVPLEKYEHHFANQAVPASSFLPTLREIIAEAEGAEAATKPEPRQNEGGEKVGSP
jgi:V8-like Glu-specific endopeptidase